MDSWSPAQLKMMQAGGNDQLNNFFSVSALVRDSAASGKGAGRPFVPD